MTSRSGGNPGSSGSRVVALARTLGLQRTGCALAALVLIASGCSKSGSSGPTGPGPNGNNHAPTVYITATPTRLAFGEVASFSVTGADQDGDQLTFAYSGLGGTVTVSGSTATSGTFTAGTARGNASVRVVASDGHGGSANATAGLYVYNPNPPNLGLQVFGSSGCAWFTFTVQESLLISVTTERFRGQGDLVVGNDFVPGLVLPGTVVTVNPDQCDYQSGDIWRISCSVQRPRDGVSFEVVKSKTF